MLNLRSPGAVLLVSCYELGHQPLGVALPLAFLERAGFAPQAIDISVEDFDPHKVARARFVGISVPMHTALRLGVRVAERVRQINPQALLCFYGLYAALNSEYLLEHGADFCIGGEIEAPLVNLLESLERAGPAVVAGTDGAATLSGSVTGVTQRGVTEAPYLRRLPYPVPSRAALPMLSRYACLEHGPERRVTGYVEASRGCLHLCTHCPIPPVYSGRFFAIPEQVVLDDIRSQVNAGARHITFGDPDFLNGPSHALRVVRALHAAFPEVSFDFTAKIEHVLKHPELFPEFAASGCLFMVSAVESLSDTVLTILDKNHTRRDVSRALEITRAAGITLRPTWVPFTPWTTRDDYCEMLAFIADEGVIDHVDPVQYSIRLLVPPGSYLVTHAAMLPHLGPLDQASFSYRWVHPDPGMDGLQKQVAALVEADAKAAVDPALTFARVRALADGNEPEQVASPLPAERVRAPRLSEPWFC
jgi:radical SAM superfamily enzyme YgiQ (UPF0313 family)